MNWRELQAELASTLGSTESRVVVEEVSGAKYAALFSHLDAEPDTAVVERARALTARRATGEPLQRVLGHWSFRGLELELDARALVPRPETELVVGHVLRALSTRRGLRGRRIVLDLGTGSGAIGLAIAAESPDTVVIATDRSLAALALTSRNRDLLGGDGDRVHLVCGEWYRPFGTALDSRLDVIVANPPYLSVAEWEAAPPVVRDWDPPEALIGGVEGTEAIGEVVAGAPRLLSPGGTLVVEIGAAQGETSVTLASRAGAARVAIERDLAGHDRVLVASW